MAKSILRRVVLALTIFAAALALPLKVVAQVTVASTEPGVVALRSDAQLPDAPVVAALAPDSASVFGRDAYYRANAAAITPEPAIAMIESSSEPRPHRFWDRENALLFSAVGSVAAADFYVTHANLACGGKELNPVTRVFAGSTPALATNFALETTSVIAVSYLFYKTGHHRLERATSLFSIGGSSAAVAYDLTHR
jgi:hypothetical protein